MDMVWCTEFQDADKVFVACGTEQDDRPVFRLNDDGKYEERPLMRYPGCLKFMPYATVYKDVLLSRKKANARYERV